MPDLIETLIAEGYTGRKGKGGFYRLSDNGGKTPEMVKEVIDLQSGTWSKAKRLKPKALKAGKKGGLRAVLNHDSELGQYAWEVLAGTLSYAASLVPEIADNIELFEQR